MIILNKARGSLDKLLSTRKGKIIAIFIYFAFGKKIAPLIGIGIPIMFFFDISIYCLQNQR